MAQLGVATSVNHCPSNMASRPVPSRRPVSPYSPASLAANFRRLAKKNSFLYVGLPMMASVVAGSFVIAHFQETRMQIRDEKFKMHRNEEELGIRTGGKVQKKEKPVTLEEELKAVDSKVAKTEDDWDFKRVSTRSRAWEKE
ncbi:cytochrome c oxidase assembly protein COX16-domain-containing protein [Hyaloraphidium curvatum]|nr:cytochrome c oxidase assembly protein COX16-domain-containing protein [Hyaloraphidium curvatum]